MTLAQVLQLINSNIIPNNNNEITANVLRPILVEMLQQPNDLIGLLSNLTTSANTNLVEAINELKSDIDQLNNISIYQGVGDPNLNTSLNPNIADFYSQLSVGNTPIDLWIYNGVEWISLKMNYVSFDEIQPLTPTQQQTARNNIGSLGTADLDGFVYDVQYNSSNHQITFYSQNEPNIVIDLPIEQLIKGVQLVGDDLVFTFEDSSTVSVPLNTLLVGVVKSVNGLTPNSQGEIILNITDIPGLSSSLDVKANTTGNYPNMTVGNADKWNNQSFLNATQGDVSMFMTFDHVNSVWRPSTVEDVKYELGVENGNTAYNERVTQFNTTYTTSVYTFSILLANGVQKQTTLQVNSSHFVINGSGVLQLNAAIAQRINDSVTTNTAQNITAVKSFIVSPTVPYATQPNQPVPYQQALEMFSTIFEPTSEIFLPDEAVNDRVYALKEFKNIIYLGSNTPTGLSIVDNGLRDGSSVTIISQAQDFESITINMARINSEGNTFSTLNVSGHKTYKFIFNKASGRFAEDSIHTNA